MTDLRNVDLNLIVVLDAVLAERNLTRAGERIGMSQPTVSAAVGKLRRQLGDALLVRTGNTFELTPTAQRLQPAVERAMREIRRTLDVMPGFDPLTTTRTFYISGSDYTLVELTGPLQGLLRERAPHAHVSFDSLPMSEAVSPTDLLRRDAIDSGRTTAPLVVPDGAIHLDTTPWTLEEVVERVVAIVEQVSDGSHAPADAGHRASP